MPPKQPPVYDDADDSDSLSTSTLGTLDKEVSRYLETIDNVGTSDSHGERPSLMDNVRFYPGAERDSYDYNNERYGIHKTTLAESIAHLIKGAMGAGVMIMHEAFMYGGLWASLGTTFCIGFINTYTMYMLSRSAQIMYIRLRVSKLSYPDLAEVAAATGCWKRFRRFSKKFRHTVDICIVLYMCGTCCIYQIMIANTFKQVLLDMNSQIKDWLQDDIRLYILISSPILLILCVIRSLKFLAPFSMLADIFVAVCVLATLYYSLQTNQNIADRPAWKSLSGYLEFCALCIYCTCGIAVCLPIENNMRQPRQFIHVLKWAMSVVVILMATTGFFGYWGWGENCRSPINIHMPPNVFTGILQLLLGIMLCVTFVVHFWVAFRIFWYYFCKRIGRNPQHSHKILETILRLFFTALVTCLSILIPSMIPMMTFIGLFMLGFINFIFPAFIESLITWKYDREARIRWRLMKNTILILFGFFMSGSSFYSVLSQ